MRASILALAGVLVFSTACQRESRQFEAAPTPAAMETTPVSDLYPGGALATSFPVHSKYEVNAYALSEGKRLFSSMNCSGCHANGGGGMGPALTDDLWAYGHEPDQIALSIVQGRPNGMPSYRGKLTDDQVWQLAAYVRSLGGFAPKDAAPGRDDHMQGKPPEASTPKQQPKNSGIPAASVR